MATRRARSTAAQRHAAAIQFDLSRLALAFVVVVYVALASLYATLVVRWYAPDEPAHFNYIRHIADTATLPILEPGDFPASYLDALKSAQPPFPRDAAVDRIRYESHQPPLYYLLGALTTKATEPWLGEQLWLGLRGLSIGLGALQILLVWAAARALWPANRWLAVAVAAFPVMIPMRVAMTAAINNDTLAEVVLTAVALALAGGVTRGFSTGRLVVVGVCLGLCLLTKLVDYVAVALPPLALCLRAGIVAPAPAKNAPAPTFSLIAALAALRQASYWRSLLIVFGVAALVAGWWFVRAALVYGPTDLLGLGRHDAVMGPEPRTHEYIAALGWRGAFERWVSTLAQSFWAQFGWMSILLETRWYTALNLFAGLATGGAVAALGRWRRGDVESPVATRAALALWLVVGLAVLSTVLYYNARFWQPQGRYLFPASVPISLIVMLGLRELAAPRYRVGLAVGLFVVALALHAICLRFAIVGFFQSVGAY